MAKTDRISLFISKNSQTILNQGSPWSRYILLTDDAASRQTVKESMLAHPNIRTIIKNLADEKDGIPSLSGIPAYFHNYSSFYWQLRFLADIGLTADELGIQPLMNQLVLQQMEDGQFLIRYHAKKQQAISRICVTAHLTYCLARMGLKHTRTVNAALEYIFSTQRKDGGWHCDRMRQNGERDENLPSCPGATIHVLKALSLFKENMWLDLAPSAEICIEYFKNPIEKPCLYEGEKKINISKLRYPPHYSGLDILNLFGTLSCFSEIVPRSDLLELADHILLQWDGTHRLASQKKIPGWSSFNFSHNGRKSSWLSAVALRALIRWFRIDILP